MKKIIRKLFTPLAVLALAIGVGINLKLETDFINAQAINYAAEADFTLKSAKNSAYNNNWTYGSWELYGAANNNGGWAFMKFGGKNSTLATANPVYLRGQVPSKSVSQIDVVFNAGNLTVGSVNSWGVDVYSDSDYTNLVDSVLGGTMSKKTAQTLSLVPTSSWAPGLFYKVYFDLANTSSTNGIVWVDKIQFVENVDVSKTLTNLSFTGTPTKTTYFEGETFDPAGLTLTASFDDGTSSDVTSLATFYPDPLTVGTTSVTASYSYGGVTKTTVISGITVQVADFSDVKYEITGKNTFSTIGLAPTGSSATLVETYSTSKQITGGNSQTVTLTGYNNVRITQITLSAKSNTSKGAGNFQYSLDGVTFEDIIPTSNFNNSNWYGAWSTSYVDVVKDVNIIVSSSSVILKVNATVSSLYVESYSIRWEESEPDALESLTMNKTESAILVGRTEQFGVTPTPATAPAEVTWSSNNETVATVDSTGLVTAHSVGTATITATSVSNTTISASVVITVPSLDTIEIEGDMTRKSYYTIDSWDITGLTVTAMYSNTDIHDIPNEDVTWTFNPAAPNSTSITSVEVTATYEGISDSKVINVTVTEKVSTVVISEVYGGGGNSGSLYRNDFVELYNNTDINIDISGWTVHYASATGGFNNKTTLPDNSIILPYSYYLVKWAAGSSTTVPELPTADVEGSVFAGATNLKVALTNNDTAPNSPTDTNVVDYVGAGNATAYEGAVAPGPSNSESISRTKSGNIYVDTDNNSADFTVGAPTPMNSALSIAEKIMETDTEMQCVTKFPEMKALVVQLSEGQLEYFQSTGDETLMVNARARYLAWAAYLGDNDAYGNGTGSTARSTTTNSSSNNVAAIALIGVIGITSLVGYYFINKKRLTA